LNPDQIARGVVANEIADHRKRSDVRDGEFVSHDPFAGREPLLDDVEQAA